MHPRRKKTEVDEGKCHFCYFCLLLLLEFLPFVISLEDFSLPFISLVFLCAKVKPFGWRIAISLHLIFSRKLPLHLVMEKSCFSTLLSSLTVTKGDATPLLTNLNPSGNRSYLPTLRLFSHVPTTRFPHKNSIQWQWHWYSSQTDFHLWLMGCWRTGLELWNKST